MSENISNNRNIRNDEVDLLDLFNRIGRAMNLLFWALWKAILISLVFIVRRWIPLAISIAVGLAVSFYLSKTSPSLYTSDMVVRSNLNINDQMISYINRLQTVDKKTLASVLGLSELTSRNIASIGAYWIIDRNHDKIPDNVDYSNSHDVYDTTDVRMLDRVDISVKIVTPQDLSAVREGILKYISENPEFMKMNELRLNHNEELLKRTVIDIQQLDSLQKVKYFRDARDKLGKVGGQIVFIQEQPTQLYHDHIYSLYAQKAKLEDDLGLYTGIVTMITDFSIPTIRVNNWRYYAKKNVPPIFISVLVFLVILANIKRLREVYNKY